MNKLEELAAIEHERYVISITAFLEQIKRDYKRGYFKSIPEMIEHYHCTYNKMWRPYAMLTEAKKSYGRNWAKQMIKVLEGN